MSNITPPDLAEAQRLNTLIPNNTESVRLIGEALTKARIEGAQAILGAVHDRVKSPSQDWEYEWLWECCHCKHQHYHNDKGPCPIRVEQVLADLEIPSKV